MENISIVKLFKKYIKNTEKHAFVIDSQILICSLTNIVIKSGNFKYSKVYINTRVLKHLYDKRPAEEFDYIIHNILQIIKYPDYLYLNKNSKRGNIALVKTLNKFTYFCPIETLENEENFVVTVFRTDQTYLKKYELIWSWKDDGPSS